jgi:hypothetical protein
MAEWYYTTNNQQMGPISWDELRQLASSGLLQPTDMVWKEGMADWAKASRTEGLFRERSAPRREIVADDLPPRRTRDRGRAYDDDYDDRPRRRRRSSEGMPLGAKVAIIGGSIAMGLIIFVVIIVLLVRGGGVGGTPTVQVVLNPGQEHTHFLAFNAGQRVQLSVRSQASSNTDVDLFVHRNNGLPVAADQSFGSDSYVTFLAPATELYRIRIVNLANGRGGRATCSLYVR